MQNQQKNNNDIPPYERSRFHSSRRGRSLNRRELRVVRWFFRQLPADSLVLDVPAGTGRFLEIAHQCGHQIIAIDNNLEQIHYVKEKLALREISALVMEGDIFSLPLADNAVDAAICIRLLHWFTEEQIHQVLAELARVARDVFVTYYEKNTIEGLRKRLRGFRGKARNYTHSQMIQWARAVGLPRHRDVPGTGFYRRCQFLWLSR